MPVLRPHARRDGRFPETFVFGVATSDHQCEAYDPAHEDIRDIWERATGRTPRGRATDFWNRYPEDIGLAREIGCKAFRFSVSWTRVEPEPGRYDEAALEHYRTLAERIVSSGMRVVLTLHHFTWPPHLEAEGGMLGESFPDHFAAYAEVVARRLAPHVTWWITINEPTFLPLGYLKPWGQRGYLMPPGLGDVSTVQQIDAASSLIRNLFVAHTRARARIREVSPGALVGANPFVLGMPDVVQDALDALASRTDDPAKWQARERGHVEGIDAPAGDVDVVMGALSWTPERERHVLFSEPYAASWPQLLVPAASAIADASDLGGVAVAVVRGSNLATLLHALPRAPRLEFARTLPDGFERLRRGRVSGLASDDVLLDSLAPPGGALWRRVPLASSRSWYCAAVAPGQGGLLREVDAAIEAVVGAGGAAVAPGVGAGEATAPERPRRLVALASTAAATATGVPVSRGVERIRARGELVVGVRGDIPPFARFDSATERWNGLEADIARALSQRLLGNPGRVRFVELEARDRMRRLHSPRSRMINIFARWRGLFSALSNTNWWYLGLAGRLPEFLCPSECVGQLDFVGFDYYWGVPEIRWDRVRRLLDSLGGRYSLAPVYPGGLMRLLRRYRRMFPGKDLLVIENGSVEHADGVARADYLRSHLREVQRAVRAGIPVAAYICWSITTNREWGLPLGADSDFGLYRIDLDTDPALKRVRTPAADTYAAIIRERDWHAGQRPARPLLSRIVEKARRRIRRRP